MGMLVSFCVMEEIKIGVCLFFLCEGMLNQGVVRDS